MKSLHKPEVWQKVLKESKEKPVILFKHSNSCPVSSDAHDRVKKLERQGAISESMYILIVQNAREISDKVAEDLGVQHETPQVIVIRDKEAAYHESHEAIDADTLTEEIIDAR
jgi:bacillithiol system protein YtxJ